MPFIVDRKIVEIDGFFGEVFPFVDFAVVEGKTVGRHDVEKMIDEIFLTARGDRKPELNFR